MLYYRISFSQIFSFHFDNGFYFLNYCFLFRNQFYLYGLRSNIDTNLNMSAQDLYHAYDDVSKVRELLQKRVNPNLYRDREGWTPLYHACVYGDEQIVREILNAGANFEVASYNGWTPLMAAAFRGHLDVVKMLLDYGADQHRKNEKGWTALDFARKMLHQTVVDYLMQHTQISQPAFSDTGSCLLKLWNSATNGSLTEKSVIDFLNYPNVNSIQALIIAHNVMLLAVRQRVIKLERIKYFQDNPNYLAKNIYLSVREFMLTLDESEKVLCNYVLRHAQKSGFIENHHVFSIELNADCFREIHRFQHSVSSVLENVARKLQDLDEGVQALELWSSETINEFRKLCENNARMAQDIANLSSRLNKFHDILKGNARRKFYGAIRW